MAKREINLDGVVYSNLHDTTRDHNLGEWIVVERLRKGGSIQQSFELAEMPETHK